MMHERFCETCGMKLRSTPESKLTQCCCCMAIDAQQELHDSELTKLRAENARLKSAHGHMEQELNTLRSREMNIDDISDYTESIERLRQKNAELVELMREAFSAFYQDDCQCGSCVELPPRIESVIKGASHDT